MEPRIALCHEWLTTYGGSEQVAERIARALDIRDVYTFTAEPALVHRLFPDHRVFVSPLGRTDLARRRWQLLLPAMVSAWRRLDLAAYDAVVTSAHAAVNAIRVRPGAVHVSYCHGPMRYAWNWRLELGRLPAPLRPVWPAAAAALRAADRGWARNVHRFVANSRYVAERISRSYGREADVVHPPIDTAFWTPGPEPRGSHYLFVGRFVAFKRPDIAIEAARLAGVPLVVAGYGPDERRLRRLAGPDVRFVVDPALEDLRRLYRSARAFLNPGVEDFGMTMAEAQACGTPVVAYGAGGATEAVADGVSGLLYDEPSAEALASAIRSFEGMRFDPVAVRGHAERFAPERFDEGIRRVVDAALATGG